jgi:hypothetical protein
MGSRDQLRAADADRERAADRLRQALEEGRIGLHEFDERLREAFEAKTFGDLDRVTADLPTPAPVAHSEVMPAHSVNVPPSRHQENPKLAAWLSNLWRLWFVVTAVNLVVWFVVSLTTGSIVYFWPIWVALPWGVANVALTILFPPRHR